LLPSHATEEGCPVTAVVEPMFLLPACESRRACRDALYGGLRHIIGHSPSHIRELRVELLGGRAVRNTPRAETVYQFMARIGRAGVYEAAPLTASYATRLRRLDDPGTTRIRVIGELGKLHARIQAHASGSSRNTGPGDRRQPGSMCSWSRSRHANRRGHPSIRGCRGR